MLRSLLCLSVLLLTTVPLAYAGDPAPAPTRVTPDEVARWILTGDEKAQTRAARALAQADAAMVKRVLDAVRARLRRRPTSEAIHDGAIEGPVAMVQLEVRFFAVPEAQMAAFLGALAPKQGHPARTVTDADVQRLLRAVEESTAIEQISAPRITVFDGQAASVSVLNQVAYIKDYEIEVTEDGQIANPVVGVVQDGILLDLRPSVAVVGKAIEVDFEGSYAVLQRPIKEHEIVVGDGTARLQLPEVDTAKVRTRVTLEDGGHALIVGGAIRDAKKEERRVVSLLSVNVIELDPGTRQEHVSPNIELEEAPEPDGKRPGIGVKRTPR